ncbi:MAG: mannose-6-phosphate isomerase, class I [Desulfobacterales bacterium]|nr:mannose-6-phosphate isomerase, class I [Desulfobacterales bacterium]
MERVSILKNSIQEYAWGSLTAIPDFLGKAAPSGKPQAELWMGAHPKAPSKISSNGRWVPLHELIERNPVEILGKTVADNFGRKLPYLFKLLAVASPLSIQAHPDRIRAEEGFHRENDLGIPAHALHRNYKDDNHKPECLCALTPFWVLAGFRKIKELISLMERICDKYLDKELMELAEAPNARSLKKFFSAMMNLDPERKIRLLQDAAAWAEADQTDHPAFQWVKTLYGMYPSDIGVLSPLFLNLICLQPGEALFVGAGELHAYLSGVGLELMANSDNVVRGGLTVKHVDVPELLKVVSFAEKPVKVLKAEKTAGAESAYPVQAREFALSMISVGTGTGYVSPVRRSVEIIICTEGQAVLSGGGHRDKLPMCRGVSVFIPAAVSQYELTGNAIFYKASVPAEPKGRALREP